MTSLVLTRALYSSILEDIIEYACHDDVINVGNYDVINDSLSHRGNHEPLRLAILENARPGDTGKFQQVFQHYSDGEAGLISPSAARITNGSKSYVRFTFTWV